MPINTLYIAIILIAIGFSAHADDKLSSEPTDILLNTVNVASGNFIQRKYFAVLKKPFISEGEIHIDNKLGMIWQTNQPIYSRMLLKHDGLFTENNFDSSKKVKGGEKIASTLMYAMIGSLSEVQQQFLIKKSLKNHCLELLPKNNTLSSTIRLIEICNGININRVVTLFEHSGNRTEISLELTPKEQLTEAISALLK